MPFQWNKEEEGKPVMVKRKLDNAVKDLQWIEKFVNQMRLYATCEKSGGLHLAEPGFMVGWLTKFGQGLK